MNPKEFIGLVTRKIEESIGGPLPAPGLGASYNHYEEPSLTEDGILKINFEAFHSDQLAYGIQLVVAQDRLNITTLANTERTITSILVPNSLERRGYVKFDGQDPNTGLCISQYFVTDYNFSEFKECIGGPLKESIPDVTGKSVEDGLEMLIKHVCFNLDEFKKKTSSLLLSR